MTAEHFFQQDEDKDRRRIYNDKAGIQNIIGEKAIIDSYSRRMFQNHDK